MKLIGMKVRALLSLFLLPFIFFSANAQSYGNYPNPYPGQFPNQDISRFRWSGVVDGTTLIHVRGRQVQVESRSGLPVQRQRYDFTDPLPRASVELDLTVLEGRGRVRLVEYPRSNNNFTATVRIDDNSGGRDVYSFELRWYDRTRRDEGGGWSGQNPRSVDGVVWRGRVDGESIIRFRNGQSWDETISGAGVSNARFQFEAPLPSNQVSVNLTNTEGRGEIVIIEQPSRNNQYTASVRIRDRQNGSGNYAFTLAWEKQRYRDADQGGWRPDPGNGGRGLRWAGQVDGSDLIFIRGNQLWVEHREGQAIRDGDHRFFQPLPNANRSIAVRKITGRGSVRVIEQPSRNNNYTATILIEDRDGGSDRYEIEVEW
ncbi:MAG: hypothetical protein ACREBD_00720 [Blastocatellia bacterium]